MTSKLYQRDEKRIITAFVNNIESLRLIKLNKGNDSIPGLPYPIPQYNTLYYGLDGYYDEAIQKHKAIDQPISEWMDVQVVRIHYSLDSLKCVALITVNDHGKNKGKISYNGYALLGFRDNINDELKVYPTGPFIICGFPSRRSVTAPLLRAYYNLGAGKISDYKCGVNSPEFFETAPEFQYIDSLGLYAGETYMDHGKRYPLIYYSNQDDTMDKSLLKHACRLK